MSFSPTPSRLPRFGSSNLSFLSKFQKKPPPTPPKPATPLTRSYSVATNASSPLADKPLPSPPVAQVLHQEIGRTLLDASEVPMALSSRPLSPTRQAGKPASDQFWDIPRPPATTPDRSLQKRPSYHELKRKASEFIGIKVPEEEAVPPMPPIPAGFSSEVSAAVNTTVVDEQPSTPTPIRRSRLTAPTAIPMSRIGRNSSPLKANPGSFKSTNSKTMGSGLSCPTGPPRSAGQAPPRTLSNNVSSSIGVVQQAPAVQPRRSSLARPTPAPLSIQTRLTSSIRGRIPVISSPTANSEGHDINADSPCGPALALASGSRAPSGPLPAFPLSVKSPTSSGPAVRDVAPVAVDEILPALAPLGNPPRPYASPRHIAKASQASRKSHAAKTLAGAPSTIALGSPRASSGSHEDTLPKTPSPLRDALTLEHGEEPEVLQPEPLLSTPAAPTLDQLIQVAIYSMSIEERPAFMELMTVKKEKAARKAEEDAKAQKKIVEMAEMVHTRLHREVQETVVRFTT
ncbi:Secondary metabolism regulator [Venturia nashicola]|nr:Secondary metabolism regulator [Venturia nashicola]